MDEILRKRIERKLDGLPEDKAYQVLDYLEFLESKYGSTARRPTPVERLAEGVGDALRAVRVPAQAISGTMNAVDSAGRMVERLAAAGRAAVEEIQRGTAASSPPPTAPAEPAQSPGPAASAQETEGGDAAGPEPAKPGGPA